MEKHAVAIAVFVFACFLPIIASSLRVDPSFDIFKHSFELGKRRGLFDYYKLGLEWPKSVCSASTSDECESPIKSNFTIHYLQPFYMTDNRVPPYDESNCNSISPSSPERITEAYLTKYGILDDMTKYWPNLFGYSNISLNLEYWRLQWAQHGMCSSYPVYPDFYFNIALTYIKALDLKKIFKSAGIVPNNKKYEAGAFARAIESKLGVRVQIRCKKNADNVNQFYEAFLCIDRLNFLKSCPTTKYYSCSENEKVLFPSV